MAGRHPETLQILIPGRRGDQQVRKEVGRAGVAGRCLTAGDGGLQPAQSEGGARARAPSGREKRGRDRGPQSPGQKSSRFYRAVNCSSVPQLEAEKADWVEKVSTPCHLNG